jgi:hypothetical protein
MELKIIIPLPLDGENVLNLYKRGKEDLEKIAERFPYDKGTVKREIRIYYENRNASYTIQDLSEDNQIIHHDPLRTINAGEL